MRQITQAGLALLVLAFALCGSSSADRVLVVCPPGWQASLNDWRQLRQTLGHQIDLLKEPLDNEAISAEVQRQQPDYLLLVGTHEVMPTRFVPAVINRLGGSEAEIATDYALVDPDRDGRATTVVARVPVATARDAERYFARVIRAEQTPGDLREEHQLQVVASPGRFSPFLDRMIEATAVRLLSESTPPACPLQMTYADWQSPYCPNPVSFSKHVADSLSHPGYWIYLGHGLRDQLDPLRTPQGRVRTLDAQVIAQLHGQRDGDLQNQTPARVAAIIACYAGAVDSRCLAEQLIASPAGPLTVIAGSRVTMPYGNAKLGAMLLDELFEQSTPTIGRVLHNAKQRMVGPEMAGSELESQSSTNDLDTMLELMASSYAPDQKSRRQERIEHAQMYHLFGDPLLSVRRPESMPLDSAKLVTGDENISGKSIARTVLDLRVVSPCEGMIEISLVKPRDHALRDKRREVFSLTRESRTAYDERWRDANKRETWSKKLSIGKGSIRIQCLVPADVPQEVVVRLVSSGEDQQYFVGQTIAQREATPTRVAQESAATQQK